MVRIWFFEAMSHFLVAGGGKRSLGRRKEGTSSSWRRKRGKGGGKGARTGGKRARAGGKREKGVSHIK